ncbi:MAG: hypothetical protein N2V73_03570 [Candidatus Methanospirare jalkutatii]|nr:hypothetical protein [Candidatus Methanospirare jalkutatii]
MKDNKKYDPDVLGITSTTSMMPDAYAKVAKMHNENVKIVIGRGSM